MKIRAARPEDAAQIGIVHVASLRASHASLLPQEFLDNLSEEKRGQVWLNVLQDRIDTHFIFVAEEDDGTLVGFSACGPETKRREDYPGEIYTCYVLEDRQGRGIGRSLLQCDLQEFRTRGYHAVMLWVLRESIAARAFYERLGGSEIDERIQEFAGVAVNEIAYGWILEQ